MKILVCGGRDYTDLKSLYTILSDFDKNHNVTAVVHGAASGADSLAGRWAEQHGKVIYSCPADWENLGKSAGPIRNQKMLIDHPDIEYVIAFPGGRGTADMIEKAKKRGVKVLEIPSISFY